MERVTSPTNDPKNLKFLQCNNVMTDNTQYFFGKIKRGTATKKFKIHLMTQKETMKKQKYG